VLHALYELIRAHVFAGDRVHGDETTVPVLAKQQTRKGRLWTYVRDDKPFAGPAPPAALFFYSRDRTGEHPERHLQNYAGILQADGGSTGAPLSTFMPDKDVLRKTAARCTRALNAGLLGPFLDLDKVDATATHRDDIADRRLAFWAPRLAQPGRFDSRSEVMHWVSS
jgi:hypothetical protein